jgi:hypothetical protein
MQATVAASQHFGLNIDTTGALSAAGIAKRKAAAERHRDVGAFSDACQLSHAWLFRRY